MSANDPLDAVLSHSPESLAEMRESVAALDALLPMRGDPKSPEEMMALLRILYRIARRDLPLARIFEGHVDALQIVARYGDPSIADAALQNAANGQAYGVWNAALPDEPLRIEDGRLYGGKSFASGAGILSHALGEAETPEGNRLILIDLEASRPAIDRAWWKTVGMARSHTHRVRWNGADAASFVYVGAPGDYAREPWFSGGALRFVACHAGGVAALFDHVRDHLLTTGRASDPHQSGRLADLHIAAQAAASAVRHAAESVLAPDFTAHVAAARVAVTEMAEQAIATAQAAVGVSAMFVEHPLSRVLTDLTVYLRQPMRDVQRMRVGESAADGLLAPAL